MPRIDPAIAPRGPSNRDEPVTIDQNNNPALPAVEDDPLARVRALAARPDRYIREPNPFTMALWAALNEPAVDVVARHAMAIRATIEAQTLPPASDEPGERPVMPASLPPTVTAIQAVTDAVVARAIQGDQRASEMIANRIEGNPGQRRGDVDPEADAARARVRSTIEVIVRDMAERAGNRADRATPIDVEVDEA
jgi:hypothetical protein